MDRKELTHLADRDYVILAASAARMRYHNGLFEHRRCQMSSLLEFLLLAAFFGAYLWRGIFFATGVLMVGSVVVLAVSYWRTRKLEPMPLAVTVLALVLGGVTLISHDPVFIKWKFSIVEWLFGLVFIGSHFMRRPLIQKILGSQITLPPLIWNRLNLMWAGFFLLLGCVNVFVIYQFDTATWVQFKVWWSTGAMLVFVILQAIYMSRHIQDQQPQ
jgi:intracellular septation protein